MILASIRKPLLCMMPLTAAVFMIIRKRISASDYPQVMIRQGRMPCAFPILMAIMFRRKGEAEKQRAPIKIQ
jgi:hypothetical protein